MMALYDQTLALAGWLFLFTPTNFLSLANQIVQCPFSPEWIEFYAWKEVAYLGWMDNKVFKSSKNNLIFICISKKQNYVHYFNFCISILVINSWNLVSISSFNSQISAFSIPGWLGAYQSNRLCCCGFWNKEKFFFGFIIMKVVASLKHHASFLMTSAQSMLLLTFNIFFNLQ